jgi:DNA-directed RNA polymerase subunit RPC12/RpoP
LVDAEDEEDAERVAMECMRKRHSYEAAAKEGGAYSLLHTERRVVGTLGENERTDTYVCSECHKSSPKRAFGQGWLKCPRCGGRPLPI